MDLSSFLVKLFGIYMLIVAVLWVVRKNHLLGLLREFLSSRSLVLFSGSIDLLIGLAIVIAHPIFEWNWRG